MATPKATEVRTAFTEAFGGPPVTTPKPTTPKPTTPKPTTPKPVTNAAEKAAVLGSINPTVTHTLAKTIAAARAPASAGGGGGKTTKPTTKSTTGQTAKAYLDAILKEYGLTSLTTWAWQKHTAGMSTQAILLTMYNTPQFKARFPGITQREKAGLPPITPATYIAYQTTLAQLEKQYNLPTGFLTTAARVGTLIGQDVSVSEVEARVQQGYSVVATAPPSVRAAFTAYFGISGTGALASYFLTPKASTPILEQQAQAAEFGGFGSQSGVNLTSDQAMQMAQMGISTSQAQSGIGQLAQEQQLFEPRVDQQGGPTQTTGIEAEFGLAGAAQATQAIQQQESTREEQFKGGGGPEITTAGSELGKAKAF